jgi:N-acetyltransferase
MPFKYQPMLSGELLELRPLRREDYLQLYAVASDPLIWEQHPVKNRSTEDGFKQFFEESLSSGGALVAIDRNTLNVIGSSRYHGYDEQNDEVEIGWTFLARSHWGGLYNREMKSLMLGHAFRFVGTVVFLVGPENIRSQRALEKIGATRAGWRLNGRGEVCCLFTITAPGHSKEY